MQTNPILGTSSALLLINDMNRSHFSTVALGGRSAMFPMIGIDAKVHPEHQFLAL